ncbi:sucrase ferredoxin [Kutzneria albida]|uniref:Sucraseferredoxin n=1 Tax=Kutzneria albida DSM 43870 TaxID=1449976 RepID=W5W5A2_9PSEU|nr:sucrase ferredoxin [Kutzneria albida]AHH96077.1 sucraseferredoxin [Kutzneria albida DSM 43870]
MPNGFEVGDTLPGCAAVMRLLGGSPAGTAAYMTSWLLVEQPGPWTADALERVCDEVFPAQRMDALRAAGLRPLLIRRPGRHRREPGAPRTVYLASGLPGGRWLERLEIADLAELAALDLEAVTRGRGGHGTPVAGPLFLACTHGTKDMCCAVLGRPVAAALGENHPGRAWEVSHVGGDRWAGNLLVVPDGYLHGQLSPDEAALVAKSALAGQVQLDQLRGRTSAPTAYAQYAEIAVRRRAGLRGLDEAIAVGESRPDPVDENLRLVSVRTPEGVYEVAVRRGPAVDGAASRCSARIAPAGYSVLSVHLLATV